MIPEIKIERSYSTRIDFEGDCEATDKIVNKAFLSAPDSIDVESFQGNAACHPYIQGKSTSMADIQDWAGKMSRYINRFKSTRFLT